MIRSGRIIPPAEEVIHNAISSYMTDIWTQLREELINASYIVTLLAGTIFIILYVAGWEKGMRYTGILFVCYILLQAILNC